MKYKLSEPQYSNTSGCGSAADCATKDIMSSSKTQNKINQLGGSEIAPSVPIVIGATEEQNDIYAKMAELSVKQQENSKFDDDVGAPPKGGSRRKKKTQKNTKRKYKKIKKTKKTKKSKKTKKTKKSKKTKKTKKAKKTKKTKKTKKRYSKGAGNTSSAIRDDPFSRYLDWFEKNKNELQKVAGHEVVTKENAFTQYLRSLPKGHLDIQYLKQATQHGAIFADKTPERLKQSNETGKMEDEDENVDTTETRMEEGKKLPGSFPNVEFYDPNTGKKNK